MIYSFVNVIERHVIHAYCNTFPSRGGVVTAFPPSWDIVLATAVTHLSQRMYNEAILLWANKIILVSLQDF